MMRVCLMALAACALATGPAYAAFNLYTGFKGQNQGSSRAAHPHPSHGCPKAHTKACRGITRH